MSAKYSQYYKGLIWTNHVLERLEERNIPQEWAWRTFKFPDEKKKGKTSNSLRLKKTYKNVSITLVAAKNEEKKWVLISCWVKPPVTDAVDNKKRTTSGFQKLIHYIAKLFS